MILNNPFHVLGLPGDCRARELTARESRIKAYLSVGKPLRFEDDLFFPGCRRNATTTALASRSLQDTRQRVQWGLFWFTRSGILDDQAMRLVSSARLAEAFALLQKVEDRDPNTPQTTSSLNNFGSLCLLMGMLQPRRGEPDPDWWPGGETRASLLTRGLRAKAKLIGHSSIADLRALCASIGDELAAKDLGRVISDFGDSVNSFADEARKYGAELPVGDIVGTFAAGGARCARLRTSFTALPRQQLEIALRRCRESYEEKDNEDNALSAAERLWSAAEEPLQDLTDAIGKRAATYVSLADQVAEALLDGAIIFANHRNRAGGVSRTELERVTRVFADAATVARGPRVVGRVHRNFVTFRENAPTVREEPTKPAGEIVAWVGGLVGGLFCLALLLGNCPP